MWLTTCHPSLSRHQGQAVSGWEFDLIYERLVETNLTSKAPPPSQRAVCTADESWVVCCASRREDEGEQPAAPAWLRGRLDWIRRLTAGPHLWRRGAERPPVCLPLHQVSIWAWREDGASQRVSKWAKRGPLVAPCGLTSVVHGPYTPLGIRKHNVYLVTSRVGWQKKEKTCERSDRWTGGRAHWLQSVHTRLQLVTSQVWVVMFVVAAVVSAAHKTGAATATITAFSLQNRKASALTALVLWSKQIFFPSTLRIKARP